MDTAALTRLAARIEALEAEKTALVRRVLRGEGDLRAADERAAEASLRFREAQARADAEATQAAEFLRDRDALRGELAAQTMLLRELPVLAARCEALEAAAAESVDEGLARAALNGALSTERALRAAIEDAFSQEALARADLENALAESHAARMTMDEALAGERKQRVRAEVALAATGELLKAAEQRSVPPSRRDEPVYERDFPRSEPPSSALPSKESRLREKGLRDELTLLGARNDALVDLAKHALRALLATVDRATGDSVPAMTDVAERLRMLLGGVAPGRAEPRLAAATVSSLGGTLQIDPTLGYVIIDFSRIRPAEAPADGDAGEDDGFADAYLLFVASWAASVYLASKAVQLPPEAGDDARVFRFTPTTKAHFRADAKEHGQ